VRVLDLFCGAAGGWSLGLHRAGFQTVAACEIDPARRAAFAHNNPGVIMYDDVRNITATRLLGDLGFLPEVVVGSPPCQDASTANPSGKGIDGSQTGLFKEFVRIVGEIRPRWVAAENVPGIRTRGADWIIDALAEIDYPCEPFVVGALHAFAPHKRKRVWFIARHADHDSFADEDWESHRAEYAEVAGCVGFPGDSDETGLEVGQGQRGNSCTELAALERAVGASGMRWNGGPGCSFRMADGIPTGLAQVCIAAYGDAVVPKITEAIGNAIRRTERMMSEIPA
jgi:DNA (cytosine-5)-methyltransferase 1